MREIVIHIKNLNQDLTPDMEDVYFAGFDDNDIALRDKNNPIINQFPLFEELIMKMFDLVAQVFIKITNEVKLEGTLKGIENFNPIKERQDNSMAKSRFVNGVYHYAKEYLMNKIDEHEDKIMNIVLNDTISDTIVRFNLLHTLDMFEIKYEIDDMRPNML